MLVLFTNTQFSFLESSKEVIVDPECLSRHSLDSVSVKINMLVFIYYQSITYPILVCCFYVLHSVRLKHQTHLPSQEWIIGLLRQHSIVVKLTVSEFKCLVKILEPSLTKYVIQGMIAYIFGFRFFVCYIGKFIMHTMWGYP